jgi:predicted PurR-regulated permease PerM
MRLRDARPPLPRLWHAAFWGAVAVVLLALIWLLRGMLAPFLIAAALAYLLDPVATWLAQRGVSRAISAVGLIALAFVVIIGLLVVMVPPIVSEGRELLGRLPDMIESAEREVRSWSRARSGADLPEGVLTDQVPDAGDIGAALTEHGTSMIVPIGQGVRGVLTFILNFVLTPMVGFYLLRDWPRLVAVADRNLPRPQAGRLRRIAREIDRAVAGFVRGEFTVALIQSVYFATTLMLVGLDYGLFVGILAGTLTIVPYIGTIVAATLTFAIAFQQFWGDWWMIGAVIAIFAVAQVVEGYVLVPNLVGSRVGLHPVWVIFSVIAFGAVFGLAGALVAVPVTAALAVLVRHGARRYRASRLYLAPPAPPRVPEPSSAADPPPTAEPPGQAIRRGPRP